MHGNKKETKIILGRMSTAGLGNTGVKKVG